MPAAQQYDYVILGGGAAGCALASRLSEDAALTVLLVEAGKDVTARNAPEEVLSGYPAKAYFNPDFTWPGLTARLGGTRGEQKPPRKAARYEQARILGGGSSINGLVANRGAPADYDAWTEYGGPDWSWDEVLPYFRKLERDLDCDGPFHGKDGPITIRRFPRKEWSPFVEAAAQLIEKRGYAFNDDQNAQWRDGVMQVTATIDENERRVSCAFAYLSDAVRRRPNLTVMTETVARHILWEGRRATGAELLGPDGLRTVRGREIIICMGTINSPAMLMRNGVGDAAHLSQAGVPVVADRPGVGRNLLEHAAVSISCYLTPGGRLENLTRHQTQAHVRFSSGMEGCLEGDMSLALIARSAWHAIGRRVGSLYFWVNNSYSQGRVTLRSARPEDLPAVDFNMLSDPRDRARLTQAFRFVAEIAASPGLDGVRTKIFPANFSDRVRKVSSPGLWNGVQMGVLAGMLDLLTPLRSWLIDTLVTEGVTMEGLLADDETLERFLDRSVAGVWHPVGTCRMGRKDDPMAVTDGHGRVHGVEGLRVCDASIMPTIPSANTNIPTIMVAERIADLIKQERAAMPV